MNFLKKFVAMLAWSGAGVNEVPERLAEPNKSRGKKSTRRRSAGCFGPGWNRHLTRWELGPLLRSRAHGYNELKRFKKSRLGRKLYGMKRFRAQQARLEKEKQAA